jgi:hypothetical protein
LGSEVDGHLRGQLEAQIEVAIVRGTETVGVVEV